MTDKLESQAGFETVQNILKDENKINVVPKVKNLFIQTRETHQKLENKPVIIPDKGQIFWRYVDGTIILGISLILGIVLAVALNIMLFLLIILFGYIVYLLFVFKGNPTINFIKNCNDSSNIEKDYEERVQNKGYLNFVIQNYQTGKKKRGRATGGRVNTTQILSRYNFLHSTDISGKLQVSEISQQKLIILHYDYWLKFSDTQAQRAVEQSLQNFIDQNISQSKKQVYYELCIDQLQKNVGYCTKGSKWMKLRFWCLNLMGLALIHYALVERNICSFNVRIIKLIA